MNLDVTGVDQEPFKVRRVDQYLQQAFPFSLVAPTAETTVRILSATIVRRQVAPRRARTQNPEDPVDEFPVIPGVSTPCLFPALQMGFEQLSDVV